MYHDVFQRRELGPKGSLTDAYLDFLGSSETRHVANPMIPQKLPQLSAHKNAFECFRVIFLKTPVGNTRN